MGRGVNKWRGSGWGALYLVDAELPLEAAARPAVQGDLHGVVDVAHLVPAHLILDVEPDHCGRQGETRHRGQEQRAACSSGTSPPSTLRHGRGGPSGSSRSGSQGHREEVGWPRSRRKWPRNKGEPASPQLEGAGKAAASGARGAGLRAAGVTTLPDARLQAGSRGSGSKGCRDPGPAFYPLCNQPCLRCSTSRGLSFLLWKMR